MATITKYKIDGQETRPFRDALDVTVSAVFGVETQADLSIDSATFVDSAEGLNAAKIKSLWLDRPTEGHDFSFSAYNGVNFLDFNFYMDYRKLRFLSDVELEVGLIKDGSITQFNDRAQGITQQLLVFKNILVLQDYARFPYIVENRKTELEKIQILYQTFQVLRAIVLEVRNLINVASDLVSGVLAAPIALISLTVSIAGIVALFVQLIDLFNAIKESFFPETRYHSAIKPKTFLEKAIIDYMGYDGIEFGTHGNWPQIIEQETWCGSKDNQIGLPVSGPSPFEGVLKPNDLGYNLFDCKELLKDKYRLREAFIDNVYHLRPEQDPFWLSNSGFIMPNVLVEESFTGNGIFRPNYEDVNSSTIIQYATDDSDLHTLDDLINEQDPATTGKIISVTTVEPISTDNRKKVLLNNSKIIDIPYALAVRKNQLDDLLDLLFGASELLGDMKGAIEERIAQFASEFAGANPAMQEFILNIGNRSGVCKIENHFFSIPKVALLEDNLQGDPRIVPNFADIIGAKALYNNHHTYDSFIPGNRNPSNVNETAAKFVFEGVRIPFGLDDFHIVIDNAYFTTESGETGKFTKIDWNVRGDFAIVDYWIYNNWMSNIEENIA